MRMNQQERLGMSGEVEVKPSVWCFEEGMINYVRGWSVSGEMQIEISPLDLKAAIKGVN